MAVGRLIVKSTIGGVEVDNVLGLGADTEWTASTFAADCAVVANQFSTHCISFQSSAVTYLSWEGFSLTNPVIGASGGLTGTGAVGQPSSPTFACIKLDMSTGLRGRAYQGRTGVVGIPENQTQAANPNYLENTYLSTTQGYVTDMLADIQTALAGSTNNTYLAVVSTVFGGVPRTPPIATEVLAISVAAQLGTRRSRLN